MAVPRGHRLEQDDAERLVAQRRRAEDVGVLVELAAARRGHAAVEGHPAREAPRARARRTAARACRRRRRRARTAARRRAGSAGRAAAPAGPCGATRRPRRAPAAGPAGAPRPGGKRVEVDAVGDDAVVALEVARRRVARRRARPRSTASKTVEDALEDRLAQPVPEEALGVGVEGGDHGALGVAQGRPAEAGHEGLVHVQHVELLGLEQHVDVGDEVERRGDDADRAVVAHREGAAGEEVARVGLVGREDGRRARSSSTSRTRSRACLDGGPVVAGRDDRDVVAHAR